MDDKPIGVFDSGVGGLTVVSALMKSLPNESIIYFGDTARVPYGTKTTQTVIKYSAEIVRFLLSFDVKAIVIACNTVSSNAYEDLTRMFQVPFVEVVTPGAAECVKHTKNKKVGVIGTPRTIESGAYLRAIHAIDTSISVYGKACPLFVPLAEEGWTDNSIAYDTARVYLKELIDKEIDTLLLACTHYPLLIETIKKAAPGVTVINPAIAAAICTKKLLVREKTLSENQKAEHVFYVSDNAEKFGDICSLVIGCKYEPVVIDI